MNSESFRLFILSILLLSIGFYIGYLYRNYQLYQNSVVQLLNYNKQIIEQLPKVITK